MDDHESQARALRQEHLAALDVLRQAKSFVLALLALVVLSHLAAWALVCHTDTLDPILGTSRVLGGDATGAEYSEADRRTARYWQVAAETALAVGGVIGRGGALVLLGVFGLALLISLSASLGGAADMTRAVCLMLIVIVLLVPWNQLVRHEGAGIPAALYTMDDLSAYLADATLADGAAASAFEGQAGGPDALPPGRGSGLVAFLRFCLYPLIAAAVVGIAQWRFVRAYQRIVASPVARLPMREM